MRWPRDNQRNALLPHLLKMNSPSGARLLTSCAVLNVKLRGSCRPDATLCLVFRYMEWHLGNGTRLPTTVWIWEVAGCSLQMGFLSSKYMPSFEPRSSGRDRSLVPVLTHSLHLLLQIMVKRQLGREIEFSFTFCPFSKSHRQCSHPRLL